MSAPGSDRPAPAPVKLETGHRVEVVRGRLDEHLSRRLVEFWTERGALDEQAARARLAEVVCVLLDESGRLCGVNSVYAGDAPLVNRRFWIYRSFATPDVGDDARALMIEAAYEELARESAGGEGGPLGLCVLVSDRAAIERHRAAVWPRSGLVYAGYTRDDAQVRIRYFEGARV